MSFSYATREDLFNATEHAVSWGEHQVWRMFRIMDIESERRGVPLTALRLAWKSRAPSRLMARNGNSVVYVPEGIILKTNIPHASDEQITFDVSWVDPWGFPHKQEKTFLEIRLEVLDEFSLAKRKNAIEKAWENTHIEVLS